TYWPGAAGAATYTPREQAMFRIAFGSNVDMYQALYERALQELGKLLQEGPSAKEVADQMAQNELQWAENIRKNQFWLANLAEEYDKGVSPDGILDGEKWIKELS